MSDIKIVEYRREYAKSIAEMWNRSGESWGGENYLETEESIIANYENSEFLHTWLAVDGEEVVGLCGFSEYRIDEGASYIPILNVRPDYHNKKVGKALVLKAVEQACQCRWPRLDLFTWDGNTKAVPLYKKCGFFWEDRDDSTHLMNFLPYVLRTEAVADFFQEADWYADSVREILVQPDGRQENGFEYYEYHWQHQGKSLKMEFERRGRGLRRIETDDWLVTARVERQNLVFGHDYTISYHLVNKSGKPLEVSIQGKDDKNISFSFAQTVQVEDELTVSGKFHVGEIAEKQNEWHTHPTVSAELLINGKKALFKVGIVPKFPALVQAVVPDREFSGGCQGQFFLNIENGYSEEAEFQFSLKEESFMHMEQRVYSLKLAPEEKKALPVDFTLNSPGLLQQELAITARPQGGEPVQFSQLLTAAFPGRGCRFGGEDYDSYFVVNGRYMLRLNKYSNTLEVGPIAQTHYKNYFMRPQLGIPYSVEFGKTKPKKAEWWEEDGVSFLKATYHSTSRPGIVIERLASLQADGFFSQQWIIRNAGEEPAENLWFKFMINLSNLSSVLPLQGGIIEDRSGLNYLSSNSLLELRENWIFSRTGNRGLCWPQEMKIKGNGWVCLEAEIGTLAPGQERAIKPVYLCVNTFDSWQKFRAFALSTQVEDITATDSLETVVNGGNLFVTSDCQVLVRQHEQREFQAKITASSAREGFTPRQVVADGDTASLELPKVATGNVEVVNIAVETPGVDYQRQVAVFGCGGRVERKEHQQAGVAVMTVDNGTLSFSAAPAFGPGVHSLTFQGREWLDSSFPVPGPRSWWNPWLGGLGFELEDISFKSLLREPRSLRFVPLEDNWGNQWQGLQSEVVVKENEKYQGLIFRHYVLTLPGLAGVATFLEFETTGLALKGLECGCTANIDGRSGWLQFQSAQGQVLRYKLGEEAETPMVHKFLLGHSGCGQNLHIYSSGNLSAYINMDVMLCGVWESLDLAPGIKQITPPQLYFFAEGDLPEGALEHLGQLRWKV
ncbi:MAG TPA: GNAT family N-acetyltransferase [Bacillota bacterium]|nr:GNAT family N-acetyltransferase [Bacillota bacterium]